MNGSGTPDLGKAPGRRTPAGWFRALYGASPAHLLILLASFAVCGYAAARLLERDWFAVAKWVVGAALVHDLVLLPLYAVADWLLHKAFGAHRLTVVNHLRVPALLSLLLLLVYWPLIDESSPHYRLGTGLNPDVFLGRWLLITAALFAGSGLLFGLRRWRAVHRPPVRSSDDRSV
jgi:hypothetical protein